MSNNIVTQLDLTELDFFESDKLTRSRIVKVHRHVAVVVVAWSYSPINTGNYYTTVDTCIAKVDTALSQHEKCSSNLCKIICIRMYIVVDERKNDIRVSACIRSTSSVDASLMTYVYSVGQSVCPGMSSSSTIRPPLPVD